MNTYLPPVKNDTKMTKQIYLSIFWPCLSWCRVVHASGRVESRFHLSEALGSLRSSHSRQSLQQRRIPWMTYSFLPSIFFCLFMYPEDSRSTAVASRPALFAAALNSRTST